MATNPFAIGGAAPAPMASPAPTPAPGSTNVPNGYSMKNNKFSVIDNNGVEYTPPDMNALNDQSRQYFWERYNDAGGDMSKVTGANALGLGGTGDGSGTGILGKAMKTADGLGSGGGSASGGTITNTGNALTTPQNTSAGGSIGANGQLTAAQLADPTKWNVTSDQTAAGQMQGLLNLNNPLLQQAMTAARQQQVANGTLNSSMADTAGLNAAYSTVLPIATNDAAVNAKASSYNADQGNQFALANMNAKNTVGTANLNANTNLAVTEKNNATTLANTDKNNATTLANTDKNNATQLSVTDKNNLSQQGIATMNAETTRYTSQLDSNTRILVQDLANKNSTLLNTNSQAASVMNTATQALANINLSTTLSPEQKTEQSRQITDKLNRDLMVLSKTSGLDLTSMLTNPYAPALTTQTGGNGTGTTGTGTTTTGGGTTTGGATTPAGTPAGGEGS